MKPEFKNLQLVCYFLYVESFFHIENFTKLLQVLCDTQKSYQKQKFILCYTIRIFLVALRVTYHTKHLATVYYVVSCVSSPHSTDHFTVKRAVEWSCGIQDE